MKKFKLKPLLTTAIFTLLISSGAASIAAMTPREDVNVTDEPVAVNAAVTYTGKEDFEGTTNLTGDYKTNSFTNSTTGIKFSYTDARDDGGYKITNNGLMWRRQEKTYTTYLEFDLANGISALKFQFLKAFTGSGSRQLKVIVNGADIATTGAYDNTTVHNFEHIFNPAISGPATVRIQNIGRQVTIDNIEWAEAVSEPIIQSVSLTGDLTTKDYVAGSDWNREGLTATANYDDGSSVDVTDTAVFAFNPTRPSAGVSEVTVTATFDGITSASRRITGINVDAPAAIEAITINTLPDKTNYVVGQAFDPTGMVVIASYSDGTPDKDVTGLTTFSPTQLTLGTTAVIASYTEGGTKVTATIPVSVEALAVTDITIATKGPETFPLGQAFDTKGLTINVLRNDGTSEVISSGFTVSGVDTLVLGNQTATISYDGHQATYSVKVTNEGASAGTASPASELFISEYVEGSSNNRALEIYNGTGQTVNLSNYTIKLYSNGGTNVQSSLNLEGSLENDKTYVIVHTSANSTLTAYADKTNGGVTGFNGDDAIELLKGSVVIDIFGVVGERTKWGENVTLVRKPSVSGPSSTYDATEWNEHPVDTFTYLGAHEFEGGVPDVTPLQQAVAFANYVATEGENAAGKCHTVFETLKTEYNFMDPTSIVEFETNNTDSAILAARNRIRYLETYLNQVIENNASRAGDKLINIENSNELLIIIIAVIGISAIAGVYYFKFRKMEE